MPKPSKAARAAFVLLHVEGLTLTVDGYRLVVRPASRLTDELRDLIREHRDELVRLTAACGEGFDPRRFPETIKVLAELRRVFGPGCRLRFATEGGYAFGDSSGSDVPISEHHVRRDHR